MTVIVMTREMGTRGKDVAAGVAERLDLDVVHHELVAQRIAQRMGLGESSVVRFLEGRPSLWERWKIDPERMSRYTAYEIIELAMRGKVFIRGWGAAQLLHGIPHVISVRVCAPIENRVDEMVDRLNEAAWELSKPIEHAPGIVRDRMRVSRKEAKREIERNDKAHAKLVIEQFGADWQNPAYYDIILDTGQMSVNDCIAEILSLVCSAKYQPTDYSLRMLKQQLVHLGDVTRQHP